MQHDLILIIDFGSQVTQLIARRIRELGVYCEVKPFTVSAEQIKAMNPKGIILSGGPSSVGDHGSPDVTDFVFEANVPILGICYGQQLICKKLGGKVESSNHREYGRSELAIDKDSKLTQGFWGKGTEHIVWMSHGDRVIEIPQGFEVIAFTENAPFAMIHHMQKDIYAVQFHPEVTHTPDGAKLLKNFVIDICQAKNDWNMHNFLEEKIADIKKRVGDDHVICAVSGGVDSSVVATLIHRAIGNQCTCIFVNTGLLRKNEAEDVRKTFTETLGIPLVYVDASEYFLGKLNGVSDPETKRKIIGSAFIDIFQEESKKVKNAKFLAQGTLYSDVIESAVTGSGETIKSHHNVGGLPAHLHLELLEPVREIFKDEVRALGRELGIPAQMIDRHPFPGPGLAIRIIGEITTAKVKLLQDIDAVYIDEIKKAGLYNEIWQAFAVLLPIQSVGVMGDGRSYEYVCALRAVNSFDGMTADFYPYSMEFLGQLSNKIINNVKGVNRIVYDITSKPPGTIEWE